jgi:hypothetical protein
MMTAVTRRQTLVGAVATAVAAALLAAAAPREHMTAVVHFGRWRDGRAVTPDDAGWKHGTIIAIARDGDRLELGRLTEAALRPDAGYNVSFEVLLPGDVPAGTAVSSEAALPAPADQWIALQKRFDLQMVRMAG